MDLKKAAAENAIPCIQENTSVGLGAGSTIGYMVDLLATKVMAGFSLDIYTSSFDTLQKLLAKNMAVRAINDTQKLDIYFDGCDQLDKDLNAIKSGGGIHTMEKLFAAMASEFILVGDDSKYREVFDNSFPIVIELLPEALPYVIARVENGVPKSKTALRINESKDGPLVTKHGNYLVDIWFDTLPELQTLNPLLKSVTGVVETSFFYKMANKAILAGAVGIYLIEK